MPSALITQPYQVLSGLLISLDKGLALQTDQPSLTAFLLEGQIVAERLMESAPRVELAGLDGARLSLQLLHKCRVWFQKREESPTLLGGGPADVVAHGLLTALEGGDGETQGNCFDRPVKNVMKMAEVSWSLYVTTDLPRTLFFRSPKAWEAPESPESWRVVVVADEGAAAWHRSLSTFLLDPPDALAQTLRTFKTAPLEDKATLVDGILRTADHYRRLCQGGMEVMKELEAPHASWDFEAQLLTPEDF